jgi:hypothetical protein
MQLEWATSNFDGQIIVMENLDPTEALRALLDVLFTHRRDVRRYGLFPTDVGSNECWTRRKRPASRPLR